MNVGDFCSPFVESCHPETNLASAAALLWEHDCGVLPVVDEGGKVVGVLTDRDICLALATRNQLASRLMAGEIMSSPVFSVHLGDSVASALKVMRQHRIRRLPVISEEGVLESVLSLSDLILAAKTAPQHAPSYQDVMLTLKAVCRRTPLSENIRKEAFVTA